jgi:hypothetical protein
MQPNTDNKPGAANPIADCQSIASQLHMWHGHWLLWHLVQLAPIWHCRFAVAINKELPFAYHMLLAY